MRVDGDKKWIMLDYDASSLYSVIADGQYHNTSAGRATWLSLIAGSSLQTNCNYEGFNINLTRVDPPLHVYLRLGLVGNNQNHCISPNSWIGFGAKKVNNKYDNERNQACGNFVFYTNSVDLPAFGYIFVQ